MKPFLLALHAGHNASVCIGDAGGLRFAIQEERLTGEKNYWGLPRNALRACLEAVGATPADIAAVAYGGKQVFCRYHSRDDVLNAYARQETLNGRLRQRVAMPLMLAMRPTYGHDKLRAFLDEEGLHDVTVSYHDHHLTHAATAYYGLRADPQTRYLVLTCDGAGDGLCASVRVMGSGECRDVASVPWDDSLGALYSWVTYVMGFVPLEHEYKLMGMAPYASERAADEAANVFRGYLGLDSSGLRFERRTRRRTNDLNTRLAADLRGMRFDHICAGLQKFTEELLAEWTANAVKATGIGKVLAAGGVFMNVKANKRIAELPEVESFQAFPSCGDETLPLGAFYLEAAARFGADAIPPLRDFYLGDAPAPDDIERTIRDSGLPAHQPADVADAVAELLVAGEPVARCAGRMEFGARALGNRSILADPSNQDVVRVINQMVKKRDFWMPFAPIVMKGRQHDYIVNPKCLDSPYMMMTFDSRENFRDMIAAVHNADLTCRAQLLEPGQNPEMQRILEAFERRTGRAVILNTSYNLHGYPIVRTAADAMHVFKSSGLRYLQLGDWMVSKG